jgi:hypothetical protein
LVCSGAARQPEKSVPAVNEIERPRGAGNRRGVVLKGFVQDIEDLAIKNDEFRRVLYTAKHCQLVVTALKPKEEIGGGSRQARPVLSRGEGGR